MKAGLFKPKNLKAAILAFFILANLMTAAQAQLVKNRLITFGDSLSDNGNLFAVSGQPAAPYNQRFSNGKVWVEYLGGSMTKSGASSLIRRQPLNEGNLNFAFGGARTDSSPINTSTGSVPSTKMQIDGFAALGGNFKPTDITTLWGGANDLLQAIPIAVSDPATADPANAKTVLGRVAETASTNIINQVKQLVRLGAKTIIVNTLPDFSNLPQFSNNPAKQLVGYASLAFNTNLLNNINTVSSSNPDVKIILIDIPKVLSDVQTNPSEYGIFNTTQACIEIAACMRGGAVAQKKFLFWDSIHPSDYAHRAITFIVYSRLKSQFSASSTINETGFE